MGDHDWTVTVWEDIGWTVRDRGHPVGEPDPAIWEFEAFQHTGGLPGAPSYHPRAGRDRMARPPSFDLDDAENSMEVRVKWDGDAFFTLGLWDVGGFNDVIAIGEVMRRIYVLASQRISGWNAESAGIPAGSEEVPAP